MGDNGVQTHVTRRIAARLDLRLGPFGNPDIRRQGALLGGQLTSNKTESRLYCTAPCLISLERLKDSNRAGIESTATQQFCDKRSELALLPEPSAEKDASWARAGREPEPLAQAVRSLADTQGASSWGFATATGVGALPPNGAWGRIRTTDTRIFSPLLYQLSYPGARFGRALYREWPYPCPGARRRLRIPGPAQGLAYRPHRRDRRREWRSGR